LLVIQCWNPKTDCELWEHISWGKDDPFEFRGQIFKTYKEIAQPLPKRTSRVEARDLFKYNQVQALDLGSSYSTSMLKVGYMQAMTERAQQEKCVWCQNKRGLNLLALNPTPSKDCPLAKGWDRGKSLFYLTNTRCNREHRGASLPQKKNELAIVIGGLIQLSTWRRAVSSVHHPNTVQKQMKSKEIKKNKSTRKPW
jgi:hypothetical protein